MALFRSNKPVVFDPYGSRRRSGGPLPRWLVILLAGAALGAGALHYVQQNHLPPRLTPAESQALLESLAPEFCERGWRILRTERRFPGAARNTAAASATGRYVLFMDDDNVADPDEIATFVRAAQASGADVLTCIVRAFSGDTAPDPATTPWHLYVPAGANAALGVFENCFGDANG